MTESMLLIAGRSSKQGTSLNKGKLKEEYLQITSMAEFNEEDMAKLGLEEGDRIRLYNRVGETVVTVVKKKATDLPVGVISMAYGPNSSQRAPACPSPRISR
ncbi:MAG: molybdopterin dinucleotide binding domain-containing protein [Gammaproteobacteria bacterium]